MVLLALFVRLKPLVVGTVGLAIIFFQQIFSLVPRVLPDSLKPSIGGFWEFIYSSGSEPWPWISILYVLVPWIGVMMAGYGFGAILLLEPERRKRICLRIGLSSMMLFVSVGSMLILLSPSTAESPPFIFRLLNQQKYPASQLYLMMTLGPTIASVPFMENARGRFSEILKVFGKVPFFYYLLHIPLINVSALLVNFIMLDATHQEWYDYAPFASVPPESQWSLAMLYLVLPQFN